jgi:Flp pilus assembly protein CpaB
MRVRRRIIARRRLVPRRVRHHPLVRAAAVVAAAAVALTIANHMVDGVLDARRRWGEQRSVVVASRRIEIGDVVQEDAFELETWPNGVVPPTALETAPVGRVALAVIEQGEAIVATRLAPDGLRGMAALVPPGSRALAVPVGPSVLALHVGDRVDLIAGFDVAGSSAGGSPTLTVARDALVVAVDEDRVTVAVRESEAPHLAFAIVAGTIVPALRSS